MEKLPEDIQSEKNKLKTGGQSEKLRDEGIHYREVIEERQAEEERETLAELYTKLEAYKNDKKALYLKTKAALALRMTDKTDYGSVNREIEEFLKSRKK